MLVLTGVFLGGSSFAEDEFYDDAPARKSGKNKKKSRKKAKTKTANKKAEAVVVSAQPAKESEEAIVENTIHQTEPEPAPKTEEPSPAPVSETTVIPEEPSVLEPEPQPESTDAEQDTTPAPSSSKTEEESPRDICIRQMLHEPHTIKHETVGLQHPDWSGHARINTEHKVLVRITGRRDSGNVIVFNDRELTIDWDEWEEEHFIRQPNGDYVSDQILAKNANDPAIRRAKRVANRLRSKKAVSSSNYGWVDRLLDYITGNTPPMVYKVLALNNKSGRFTVRFCEQEMVVSRTKNSEAAGVVLDYTGVKLHIRWEDGTVETYKRTKTGGYRIVDDWEIARQLRDDNNTAVQEDSEEGEFMAWWRDVCNEEKPLSYTQVRMLSGGIDAEPRVCMDNRILVYPLPHNSWAKVIKFTPHKLHIRWHNKKDEIFERVDDYIYRPAK